MNIKALVTEQISGTLPECKIETDDLTYLNGLQLADPNWYMPSKIDMLLGVQDFVKYVLKQGKVLGPANCPDALETAFGYIIIGSAFGEINKKMETNSFHVSVTNENLDSLLHNFWQLDEVPSIKHLSPEELLCEEIYSKNTTREQSGRYVVPLPFCKEPSQLGDSLAVAKRRLASLDRRFKKNPLLHKEYDKVIKEYLNEEYISIVSNVESNSEPCFFIPHHPVLREDKLTTKLRIVLDASAATSSGVSLNDCLHAGPNYQNDLLKIILNFRLYPIAITCDVRQMFLRIKALPEYHRYMRFLYRFAGEQEVTIFNYNVVCFGLKCSPYLAMRTVRQLLQDEKASFEYASSIVERLIYMDDIALSRLNVERARTLSLELIELFSRGGFELVKFASNSNEVLQGLPEAHVLNTSVDISSDMDLKILGLRWFPNQDYFSFTVNLDEEKIISKRSILSTIAKLWDLIGIVAPVILYAKLLIKELWLLKLGWDDTPPANICANWLRFRLELPLLENLKIPRHIGINLEDAEVTLIGFSDASLDGYGAVVYTCVSNKDSSYNNIRIACAKSKVSPVNVVTLARLELCAALLLAKLLRYVSDAFAVDHKVSNIFAFTDSTIVLHWIHSPPSRFKVFVSNRIAQINEYLPASQFYHIPGKNNPSDVLSRGVTPTTLLNHELWLHGPAWAREPISQWPLNRFEFNNVLELPELKVKVHACITTTENLPFLCKLALKYSSWSKYLRVVVFILRFIKKIPRDNKVSQAHLQIAENAVLIAVQRVHFKEDFANVAAGKRPSQPLQKLCPFIQDGLLRVGGRLSNCKLSYTSKHPTLLPKSDHIVNIIIDQYHKRFLHPGPNLLISLLRGKYWILSCRSIVRKRFHMCNRCFKVNPSTTAPFMGDLPACRVRECKPFLITGVDYAGPISVLLSRYRGARTQKMYLCLFVCQWSRAVHLELATDLSTAAFINAFKRFISRRGDCKTLYSDHGTNFIGAKAYLDDLQRFVKSDKFRNDFSNEMSYQGIDWKFTPPTGSHWGGSWETNIRSTKLHLKRVIGDQLLTYEELYTVLTQIEAILNSRPLTVLSPDPAEPTALTPAQFLTLGPLNSFNDVDVSQISMGLVKRKFLLDKIINSFWKSWQTEYLHILQTRSKWNTHTNPVSAGTVVLLNNDNLPPLKWQLGIIDKVFPGKDGIVRVVAVRTASGAVYQRPVVKVSPLPLQ